MWWFKHFIGTILIFCLCFKINSNLKNRLFINHVFIVQTGYCLKFKNHNFFPYNIILFEFRSSVHKFYKQENNIHTNKLTQKMFKILQFFRKFIFKGHNEKLCGEKLLLTSFVLLITFFYFCWKFKIYFYTLHSFIFYFKIPKIKCR